MAPETVVDGVVPFAVEERPDGSWLVLRGAVDILTVDSPVVTELTRWATGRVVRVDLSSITFVDSGGLSLLVRLRAVAERVVLAGVPEHVARRMHRLGLDGVFDGVDATPAG